MKALARYLMPFAVVAALGAATFTATHAQDSSEQAAAATMTTVDGKKISLAGHRGLTELIFVANWCPPCEGQLSRVRRRSAQMRRQNYRVILIGVSRRQSAKQFTEWAGRFDFSGPMVYDEGSDLERKFEAGLLPWHVVVDPKGKVLHSSDEPPSDAQLRSWSSR